MEVEVTAATPNPAQNCSIAAGCCYGKEDYSERRLATCLNSGHLSVFEHACATWSVKGISRACSHQLVRHRLASYSQQSQRYCKISVDNDDWYVMPPETVSRQCQVAFESAMEQAAVRYNVLISEGMKPEDARYVLPNACKTDIFITMNFRELMHFLDVRFDKTAQWEIRELAKQMGRTLSTYSTQWALLLTMYEKWSNRMLWGDKDV